jgi:hypothetical protein
MVTGSAALVKIVAIVEVLPVAVIVLLAVTVVNAPVFGVLAPIAPLRYPPAVLRVPVVVILPVAASIERGPTVRPFCTVKFVLAIVPCSLQA